jgi:hypothetical protein
MTIKSVLIAGSLSGAICAAGAGYLGYHLTAKMKDGEIAALRLSYAQAEKAAIIKAAALQKSQDDAGTRIALAAAAAHERIVTRTVTTVKEVPIYVTRETDARFPLPCGFVRLHDAAALGVDPADIPNPAGKSDGEACEVANSQAISIVAANYGLYLAEDAKLTALQDWVSAEKALSDAAAASHASAPGP